VRVKLCERIATLRRIWEKETKSVSLRWFLLPLFHSFRRYSTVLSRFWPSKANTFRCEQLSLIQWRHYKGEFLD
jgi:hypothetical protein